MDELKIGDIVIVVDAEGAKRRKRALSPVVQGGSFEVVWACREEEWQAAQAEGRDPVGIPWPAEDVSLLDDAAEEVPGVSGKTNPDRDLQMAIPLDPEIALKALLAVKPDNEPADGDQAADDEQEHDERPTS